MALFGLALSIYAVTRLVELEDWPIYFFSDEAIQPLLAADLVDNGFRDSSGDYFPLYFQNVDAFYPTIEVYFHVLPHLLFDDSIFAARATSVLIALFGSVAVGLILRDFVKIRFWWAGVLLLSITPLWFLHTRTVFQDVVGPAFYAWFLYFYLRYRHQQPRFLFLALLVGALAFYSHATMHIIVGTTGLLLLLSDFRYHWRNWRFGGLGVLFIVVLALPYVRFQFDHPGEFTEYLRIRQSYWLLDVSLREKLQRFWETYFSGLDPRFWYEPEDWRGVGHDARHLMKGYGHVLAPTLPFAAVGLTLCLRSIRSSPHRAILIAILAAPTAGAVRGALGSLQAVVMVIPLALLTAIGLAAVLEVLAKRISYRPLAIGVLAVLGLTNLFMLRDALTNGPTWSTDYTLYGMQYGAKQVFGEIKRDLRDSPETEVIVSPNWTNGFDEVMRFFVRDDPRVRGGSIQQFTRAKGELNDNMLFVMTPDEYQLIVDDRKFVNIRVEKTIKYPDDTDGFFFVRLNYSPQVDAIIAAEIAERRQPVQEDLLLDGQTIATLHSRFDIGGIAHLFDGDTNSLTRTEEANPWVAELAFPQPRPLAGLSVTTGRMPMTITATIYSDEGAEPAVYSATVATVENLPLSAPTVDLNFDSVAVPAKRIRIEVKHLAAPEPAHVEVYEIVLR